MMPPPALPDQSRLLFEEGVRYVFEQWTALCLAVENQWGGPKSAESAKWLLQETIQWFYDDRGWCSRVVFIA
jgi:hypothetical protein